MSKFNVAEKPTKTKNLAGADAYTQSLELELISILLTSFVTDQYYRKADDTLEKLKEIIADCDPLFIAKAVVYARNEFGMRSISHVCASEVAKHLSGSEWAKGFYDKIIRRPDDMTEILAYHKSHNGKIPNSMKKGFAKSFDKFDAYQLAKYRSEGKTMSLIDVVNLVHPVPVEKNEQALKQLVAGTLKSTGTWESQLTKAGQEGDSAEEVSSNKEQVWTTLVNEGKIGYFALLRNLRNIQEQAPKVLNNALEMLVQEGLIKKSLVMPFRFLTAIEQFNTLPDSGAIIKALSTALDISCNNVPEFSGNTLVACDYSGSMQRGIGSMRYIATTFGAILAKKNEADFMIFGDSAEYLSYNSDDSTLSIVQSHVKNNSGYGSNGLDVYVGHGTNFGSVFQKANKDYDRVVLFTDMQSWRGNTQLAAEDYKKRFNIDTHIYTVDLAGYGTMQFPAHKVYCLAGFSDKIFDVMKILESDRNALVNKIKDVEL